MPLWAFFILYVKIIFMYDLVILGGGPAGGAGAVYAARKQLKTAIIAYEFAGQSVVSEKIYNWIGTPEISGGELANNIKNHILYYKGQFLDVIEGEKIKDIEKVENHFKIITESGKEYESKSILIATGSGRRKLEAENADKFEHKGITYCASCDGPMFADMDVLVIGGGNAAFETVLQLLAYCKSVTLIHRNEIFKADEITVEKAKSNPKLTIITNADVLKVDGDNFANSLTYKDKISGEIITLPTSGIFVEIGQIPNTSFAKNVTTLDEVGKIKVDPTNQAGETEGIWAAGDCSNGKYHQNNIAVGDAVKAIEDIYIWLHKNK